MSRRFNPLEARLHNKTHLQYAHNWPLERVLTPQNFGGQCVACYLKRQCVGCYPNSYAYGNSLHTAYTTSISRLLGGRWLGLYGLGGHYVGPHRCSNTRIVIKSSPEPIPGAIEGFPKKSNFVNLAGVTKQPTQRQFRGFWRGRGSGFMGLAATTWVPIGAQIPVLSFNHQPNPS